MITAGLLVPLVAVSVVADVHSTWGWGAVGVMGLVGLWGLVLSISKRDPGRTFWVASGVAFVSAIGQVAMGVYVFSVEGIQPGNQHVFYGVVLMFTFAFAYIYRSQFAKRPGLAYGLLFLFSMGLGIRGIMTFGQSFGG